MHVTDTTARCQRRMLSAPETGAGDSSAPVSWKRTTTLRKSPEVTVGGAVAPVAAALSVDTLRSWRVEQAAAQVTGCVGVIANGTESRPACPVLNAHCHAAHLLRLPVSDSSVCRRLKLREGAPVLRQPHRLRVDPDLPRFRCGGNGVAERAAGSVRPPAAAPAPPPGAAGRPCSAGIEAADGRKRKHRRLRHSSHMCQLSIICFERTSVKTYDRAHEMA